MLGKTKMTMQRRTVLHALLSLALVAYRDKKKIGVIFVKKKEHLTKQMQTACFQHPISSGLVSWNLEV